MAENEAREQIQKLLSIKGTQTPTEFHRKLGKIMWDYCGMSRNEEGLKKAAELVKQLKDEFWKDLKVSGTNGELNQELEKAGRVADYFEVASLMIQDALDRKESCGAHFREEYQTEEGEPLRNDNEFMYVAAWEYTGENSSPKLNKEELKFEYVKVTKRSYK